MQVKFIAKPTLEAIARKTLFAHNAHYSDGPPSATPLELMAESIGLSIEYACLSSNGNALGKTAFEDGATPIFDKEKQEYVNIETMTGTIFIDESLVKDPALHGRYRYTLAHEMAHWILHRNIFANYDETFYETNKKEIEWQADYLAQSLLMPKGQVQKAFYARIHSISTLPDLAKIFEVSKQAMGIRLETLGLRLYLG